MPTRTILSGKLKLSREREDALMHHVRNRHADTLIEMGREAQKDYTGWILARKEAWDQYNGDFSHRLNVSRFGDLYNQFNDCSFNLPKDATDVFSARACEALLNSTPFASFAPEGTEDEVKAATIPGIAPPPDPIKLADRYWNRKLADAESMIHFRDALKRAAVCGECVVKISTRLPDDEDDAEQAIWLDDQGQPLRDARGMFVFADDEFEPDMNALEGEILKRDPSVVKTPGCTLSEDKYPAEGRKAKGVLDIKPLDYRSFVCSPTAADIHVTDYIAQEFDYDLDQLWALTRGARLTPEAREWRDGLKGQSVLAKTDESSPQENAGEKERGPSSSIVLHLAESWLRFDCRGSGRSEEICVLWDITTGYPIYYDTMRERSLTGKRPFEVLRVVPVPGRWCGHGFYHLLANDHNFCDRQVARLEKRTSTSGRLDFYRLGTLEGVESGRDIDLNSNFIYTATDKLGKDEKPLENCQLPPMDERIWELLQMRLQHAKVSSGNFTSAEAAAVKLNPSKTLGGQELLQAESELRSGDAIQDVRRGIELALRQSIVAVFTDFDVEDAREQLGIENGNVLAEWARTKKPSRMTNHVKLLMTKAKSKLQMEAYQQAIQMITGGQPWTVIVTQFPQLVEQLRPLYKAILEASDIEGADAVLTVPEPQPQAIQPNAEPNTIPFAA